MKKNVNISPVNRHFVLKFADGSPRLNNVDNFPADNPAYKKRDGWRCNDISLLDRLSFSQQVDDDFVKIVSSRVREISSKANNNLSEEQLVRTLRPSWCQTASEVKDWSERVYQYMNSTADAQVSDDTVKEQVSEVLESASVESSENSNNS